MSGQQTGQLPSDSRFHALAMQPKAQVFQAGRNIKEVAAAVAACMVRVEVLPTSTSSFSKKRSSAGFCARGRTTVRLVVLGEKATVPWDSISF